MTCQSTNYKKIKLYNLTFDLYAFDNFACSR